MDCFNRFAHEEAELVDEIKEFDDKIDYFKNKVSELEKERSVKRHELILVRSKMKKYLEQEFGIKTQN